MRTIKFLVAILISIALAACGGSSSDSTPAPTYSISGTVTQSVGGAAVSGATITLSGTSAATTTTAADGTYSFAGLANGSYTVTPSLTGNAFSPASSAVTVSGANVTGKNFTATAAATTYSISGAVSGAAGVTITLSGANSGSVVTGAGGTYTFPGLVAGNYTVTPSLAGYTFAPTSIAITGLAANSTGNNFVATALPVAHSISGNVSGTTGVTITVTGTASASATTDGSGNYTVSGLYDGSYTVTPSKTGFTFNPVSASVTMSGANVTGRNFVGTANTAVLASASGTLTGAWVEGVTITMSGGSSGTTTTNASGNYSFANLPSGQSYTFTPTLTGYTYASASQTVAIPGGSSTAVVVPNMVASSAIASYSISGTVSYPVGTQTGSIAILVFQSGCVNVRNCSPAGGAVIASPGAYTVRGLQAGNYVVVAERDALGNGKPNASNPIGTIAANITTSSLTGVNVVMADPTPPVPVTPTLDGVFPGNISAFVAYTPAWDVNGQEIATSYKIYWGTDAAASNGGNATFGANGDSGAYILSSFTNGAVLYFKMTALVGATESTASLVTGPVTIGATTGPNTVSGTVTFTGTATGPMLVGLYSNTGVYFTRIASPVSPQSYSIAGVPSGSYYPFAIIDNNNNGVIDSGDIQNTEGNVANIVVSGNTTNNIVLPSANATATVNTVHQFDGTNHNYSLVLGFTNGIKRIVSETVFSGPKLSVPLDLVLQSGWDGWLWMGATAPAVGDTYKFKLTYSDATTQNLTASVNAVISAFAQNLAATASLTPTFSWTAPATPPASYTYSLSLWGTDGTNWYYPQNAPLPSSTLSAVYNGSPLTSGNTYTWNVQVTDANGDVATRSAQFIAP